MRGKGRGGAQLPRLSTWAGGTRAGEQRWEGWEEREKNASPLKFAKKPFTLMGHHVSVDEAPLFVPGFYKFANQG